MPDSMVRVKASSLNKARKSCKGAAAKLTKKIMDMLWEKDVLKERILQGTKDKAPLTPKKVEALCGK